MTFPFSLSKSDQNTIVSHFTIDRFFSKYPRSLLHSLPTGDAASAPINGCPTALTRFQNASEQRGWRCEKCRGDFSHPADRKYLHLHHKNGMKNENDRCNLQVLCLGCHAEEPQHAHLKNLAEYRTFERRFGRRR